MERNKPLTRYTVHGRGAKRVTLTGDKSVWISPGRESFRPITVDLRALTHGHQKDRILDKNEPQKVSKKLVKNGVPEPPYPIP